MQQASVEVYIHDGMEIVIPDLDIPTFDLSYVKTQILQEHHNLSQDVVDECVRKYRNFLALCKAYPDEALMPCHDIDLVWHQHVLNTREYHKDCIEFFGKYIHHSPMMPPQCVAKRSRELYTLHFKNGGGYSVDCIVMCCRTD